MQMSSNYLDTAFGMGSSKFELVPGIDSPITATFIDAIHFVNSNDPVRFQGGLCLFELDLGVPLRRHIDYGDGFNFYVECRETFWFCEQLQLHLSTTTLTTICSIQMGLYKPTFPLAVTFKPIFWTSHESPYGTKIHKGLAGTIHDHMFHYKVDLDVGERKNSFEKC